MHQTFATVLICTYNRAERLRETLRSIERLRPPDACVDIVVVDNGSTDHTPEVIRQASGSSRWPIRYCYEQQQGKSFALNRGLQSVDGDIVAFTDDDILLGVEWLWQIVERFRNNGALQFVFGRVLPRWEIDPPREFLDPRLQSVWGPLGLLDHGERPLEHVDDGVRRRLPIGGNIAFRRTTLQAIGGWREDLGKIDNSLICGEDYEIFLRLKRRGLYRGLYDPSIVVWHFVPIAKLTHAYFRRWFYWRGKTMSRMAKDVYYPLDIDRCRRVAGVPRFLLRQFLEQCARWLRSCVTGDSVARLVDEVHAIEFLGMFSEFSRHRPLRTSAEHR